MDGQVNTHNCRIWAAKNPHIIEGKPMHPKKETVWCDFTAIFLIGNFFEEIKPNGIPTCSITGKLYHDMLKDFVTPEFQQRGCFQDTTFMQDGAPPHIDHNVKGLLKPHFTDAQVISRHFSTLWLLVRQI
ncbi:uncharacterized protein TNCV_495611 [Trichonephila clavipes]|nr:uncharacterized protein TNCV_495611 [Trichonephila clavipes]